MVFPLAKCVTLVKSLNMDRFFNRKREVTPTSWGCSKNEIR